VVDILDVITYANFGEDQLRGLEVAGGQILPLTIMGLFDYWIRIRIHNEFEPKVNLTHIGRAESHFIFQVNLNRDSL